MQNTQTDNKTAFASAGQEKRSSIVSEFIYFLKDNKKWWLVPILLVLFLLALLTFFAGTGAAPFIYTMF
jgi:Family of unknown function (DUF5989)